MMFHRDFFAALVDQWVRHRILEKSVESFEADIARERKGYFHFLEEQRNSAHCGEADYQYSVVDRALLRLGNGDTETGVRYFSSGWASDQWRFTSRLVAEIDYKAWEVFQHHLPEPENADATQRMAVIGCGRGEQIRGIFQRHRQLQSWQCIGLDIDYDSVSRGNEELRDVAHVQLHCGDIRQPESMPAGELDVVYLHGILDHCHNPRAD